MTAVLEALGRSTPPEVGSVLGKVRAVLDCFGFEDVGLPLAELVRRTGLPKATVHRLAHDLVAWGLLERDPAGFRLGLLLFELGQRVPRQRVLRDAAMPHLEELFLLTRETVHCAVLDGLEVLYVEKVSGLRAVERPSRVAGRMPLHCTATGKALLAFSPPELTEQVVRQGLVRRTSRTVTSAAQLRAQLEQVRQNGAAVEHEETRAGHSSVAAPVFGPSGVLAGALSVTAPTARMVVPRLSAAVRRTAADVAAALQAGRDGARTRPEPEEAP